MTTLRTELDQLARDELTRQELEAADRRDRIVGWVCCVGLALFVLWEIIGRAA